METRMIVLETIKDHGTPLRKSMSLSLYLSEWKLKSYKDLTPPPFLTFYHSYCTLCWFSITDHFAAPQVLPCGLCFSSSLIWRTPFLGIFLPNSSTSFKSLFQSRLLNETTLTTYLKIAKSSYTCSPHYLLLRTYDLFKKILSIACLPLSARMCKPYQRRIIICPPMYA